MSAVYAVFSCIARSVRLSVPPNANSAEATSTVANLRNLRMPQRFEVKRHSGASL